MDAVVFGRFDRATLHLHSHGEDDESFSQRVVEALSILFEGEADSCSLGEIDLDSRHARMVSTDPVACSPFYMRRWAELTTSTAVPSLWKGMRLGAVTALSDIEPDAERRRRYQIYEDVYRPLGVHDQLFLPFIARKGVLWSVGCNRSLRDFDDHHRELLASFGRHICVAHKLVEQRTTAAYHDVASDRDLRWVWPGTMRVTPHGDVLALSSGADAILSAYFGPFPPCSSLPPAPVFDWLRGLVGCECAGPASPREPWVIERGDFRLTLRLAGSADGGQLTLFLRHSQPIRPARLAADLGVTTREAEVVRELIVRGTQSLAAAALDIESNTVRSHRQAIYRKLGVKNRAELVMATQAALDRSALDEPLLLPARA